MSPASRLPRFFPPALLALLLLLSVSPPASPPIDLSFRTVWPQFFAAALASLKLAVLASFSKSGYETATCQPRALML